MSGVLDASTVHGRWQNRPQPFSSATVAQASQQITPRTQVDVRASAQGWQIERVTIFDDPSDGGNQGRLLRFIRAVNQLLESPSPDEYAPTDSEVAKRLTEQLAVLILHYDEEPSVHRLADGGLLVRWASDRGSLDIEFDADGDALGMITDRTHAQVNRRNGAWSRIGPEAMRWLYSA